ncbi:MAG: HPr family phosphocarrier protein [Alphaproteobacteria bacterium]|nr:HPr family phosphocarrier protein [Alphaproteobacteria bacterium]
MSSSSQKSHRLILVNPLGLHARAAGKLAQLTTQFDASIHLEKDDQVASADSILELMMLTAGYGEEILVTTNGQQAEQALEAVINLVQDGFGELS